LVELLVVMAIIGILASISLVGVQLAIKQSHISAEEHTLAMLKVSIESFAREMGDYPPGSLTFLGLKSAGGINEGNESLFACLLTRKRNGPFIDDLDEDRWANLDEDRLSADDLAKIRKELDWVRKTDQLLEYTDLWGNPYVYVHHRDYGKKFRYQDADGNIFEVEAAKSSLTGDYAAPTSYQLWSLGPDGVNQNGGGDDVCSWNL
ncbi:MAG: type II secretion system protein, partial [Planctomycetes bacterium]|nr:type II secretion system protein [Planctomycetota bacterium]